MSVKHGSFIGKERVELPVGGSFTRTGHVAPWLATHLWRFTTDVDEAVAVEEGLGPDTTSGEGGTMWYFKSKVAAQKVIEHYDIRNPNDPSKNQYVQHCWMLQAQVQPQNTVLTLSDENAAKWKGKVMSERVDIQALQPLTHKSRNWNGYAFQLISLPLAVAAYADFLGYDNPGFDVSELMESDQAFTDELFAHLTGDPENKSYARLDDALLWQRRTALWEALGEPDAKRFKPWEEGKVGAFHTKAEKLSNALQVVTGGSWESTVYARVVRVPNPKPGGGFGFVGLMELFKDKAEAEAALAKAKAERDAANGNAGGGLTIPATYANYQDDFKSGIEVIKNTVIPIPALRNKAKELGITDSEAKLEILKGKVFSELGLEGDELMQALEWLK